MWQPIEIFTGSRRWTSQMILSRTLAGAAPAAHRPCLAAPIASARRVPAAGPASPGPLSTLGVRAGRAPRNPQEKK